MIIGLTFYTRFASCFSSVIFCTCFLCVCSPWHLRKAKIMIDVQALHGILNSRINKAGGIQAVYVKTDSGLLFEVKTHARIPRTWKRFCGIICKYARRQRDISGILLFYKFLTLSLRSH